MLLRNWRGWHRRASRRKQRLHTRQRRRNRERNALLQPHLGGIERGAGAVRMHVANRIRQLQVRKLGRAASCENQTRAERVQQRSRVSVVLRSKTRLVLPCRRGMPTTAKCVKDLPRASAPKPSTAKCIASPKRLLYTWLPQTTDTKNRAVLGTCASSRANKAPPFPGLHNAAPTKQTATKTRPVSARISARSSGKYYVFLPDLPPK